MSRRSTIIERLLSGQEYELAKIDDEIDAWHDTETGLQLYEWLGFTREEYALYVEKPSCVRAILAARRHKRPLKELLAATTGSALLAARGASPEEAETLRAWLQQTGRL